MIFTLFETYSIMKFIFFTSLIISSLEQIFILKNKHFSKILPPAEVTILEHPITLRSVFFTNIYKYIFRNNNQIVLLISIIILSILLIIFNFNSFNYRLTIIFFTIVFFVYNYKTHYGGDGGEQMSKIIVLVLFFSSLFYQQEKVLVLGILFIAAQVILSYFTAGISKIASQLWRNGKGLKGVLTTNSYSTSYLSNLVTKYPKLTLYLSWYVIIWELLFLFSLFSNEYIFFVLLFIAFSFHLSCAIIMGLNNFFLVFTSAQVCIIYFYYHIPHVLKWFFGN